MNYAGSGASRGGEILPRGIVFLIQHSRVTPLPMSQVQPPVPKLIRYRYRYRRDLGAGGMGRVVLVEDLEEGNALRALKWVDAEPTLRPPLRRHCRACFAPTYGLLRFATPSSPGFLPSAP